MGSTWRANFKASEFTRSTFAGETARMTLFGLAMYSVMRFRVCFSMSVGWSPIGTCSCQHPLSNFCYATTYLGQTRQINQRQTENVWGVHLQVDRLPVDALVVSRYPRCLGLNLTLDLAKIIEPPTGNVQKLSPFLLSCDACWGVWHVNFVAFLGILALAREVDQLQDKRSPRYDAAASGQKVPADNVLEDRRLSGRLRAYDNLQRSVMPSSHAVAHSSRTFSSVSCCSACASAGGATYNLGEIERVIADGVENEVLEPVDDVEELLAQRRHNAGGRVWFWCSR
jgi:hypothetical protein